MLRMFVRSELADRLGKLYASGRVATPEELTAFTAARAARPRLASTMGATASAGDPENYAVVGNTAHIEVSGVLSEEPDFWSWLLGIDGTTYADIRSAFAMAGANPSVSKVQLWVGSPGGYVDGLFETIAVIEGFGKPINVEASQACSAAYALAAMTGGKIQASSPASEFGSIGVATTYFVDPQRVDIASTKAPNKRPDVTTAEGKAVVQAPLDDLHDLFVDAIARGRSHATGTKITSEQINADFGRGGVFLTAKAKSVGMIDKSAPQVRRETSASQSTATPTALEGVNNPRPTVGAVGSKERKIMTKEELQAQFPAVYSAIHGEGEAHERKRVNAHLKAAKTQAAKADGLLKVALDAIASGASFNDEEVQAEYFHARTTSDSQGARQADSDTAGAILGDVSGKPGQDFGDLVAAAFEKNFPSAKKVQ